MGLSLRLLTLVLLLALVAFFAASEFALMRLRPTRVQELAERGNAAALAIARLQRHLRRALLATQLGLSLALLALGWGSHSLLTLLHGSTPPAWLQLVVFGLLALLATLLGGLLPKAWVLDDPENAALRLGPLLESVNQALAPLLSAIEALANVLLRASGLPLQWDRLVPSLSAGELESLIENDAVIGLEPDERNILEGVFSLRDTQVREVMVPRSGMVTLPLEACLSELMEAVVSTRHARFPVIGESLDDVRGLLDLRLLAAPLARGGADARLPLDSLHLPGGPDSRKRLPRRSAAPNPQR